jgi:hypothetical protein
VQFTFEKIASGTALHIERLKPKMLFTIKSLFKNVPSTKVTKYDLA